MAKIKDDKFFRGKDGKISDKRVSPYGKKQLDMLDGVKIPFSDGVLELKGNKLVDLNGKVLDTINSDRKINKIIYRVI